MPITASVMIIFAVFSLVLPNLKMPSILSDLLVSQAEKQIDLAHTTTREKITTNYQKIAMVKNDAPQLDIGARSAIVIDPVNQKVLFEKDSDRPLAMASLAKLMSALVIIQRHKLDETVTIKALPSDNIEGSQKVGLVEGETFALSEALRILLIYSANDMANALSVWDSDTTDKFVQRMNEEAKYWQLTKTHYQNPTGLDDDNQKTTVADLAKLSRVLLTSPTISDIVKTNTYQAISKEGKTYDLTSTNQLLFTRNDIYGVKTGFDTQAGQCLITLAKRGEAQVLTVVLDSPDRFQESQNMIEWAFNNHIWQ